MGTISDIVSSRLLQPITFERANAVQQQPMVTASDENLKTNIESGNNDVDKLLDNVNAYTYEYKNPDEDGKGLFLSTMAQELEKAGPIGKSVVIDTPRGKMVDNGRLVATMLPALAIHHQQLKKIDKTLEALKRAIPKARKK